MKIHHILLSTSLLALGSLSLAECDAPPPIEQSFQNSTNVLTATKTAQQPFKNGGSLYTLTIDEVFKGLYKPSQTITKVFNKKQLEDLTNWIETNNHPDIITAPIGTPYLLFFDTPGIWGGCSGWSSRLSCKHQTKQQLAKLRALGAAYKTKQTDGFVSAELYDAIKNSRAVSSKKLAPMQNLPVAILPGADMQPLKDEHQVRALKQAILKAKPVDIEKRLTQCEYKPGIHFQFHTQANASDSLSNQTSPSVNLLWCGNCDIWAISESTSRATPKLSPRTITHFGDAKPARETIQALYHNLPN